MNSRLFDFICWHLSIWKNNYVFNTNFIEWESVLEKIYRMRGTFLHSKHGMVSSFMCRQAKICRLVSWNAPTEGWHKVNTNGAVCIETGNAIARDLVHDQHAIKGLLQLSWTVQITHVFREGNKVVNGLTSMASSRPLGRYILMQPLDEVLQLLHDDNFGMASPRLV
ncbi:hypothetical protein V6Z11_A10G197300 [Gossypium hirsutum]